MGKNVLRAFERRWSLRMKYTFHSDWCQTGNALDPGSLVGVAQEIVRWSKRLNDRLFMKAFGTRWMRDKYRLSLSPLWSNYFICFNPDSDENPSLSTDTAFSLLPGNTQSLNSTDPPSSYST